MPSRTLPSDFLRWVASEYELSLEQEEVFICRFADGQDYKAIAAILNTSEGACQKRMGIVYDKFAIQGDRRGKEQQLWKRLKALYSEKLSSQEDSCKALKNSPRNLHKNPGDERNEVGNPLHDLKELSGLLYEYSAVNQNSKDSSYQRKIQNFIVEGALSQFISLLPKLIEQIALQSDQSKLDVLVRSIRSFENELREFGECNVQKN